MLDGTLDGDFAQGCWMVMLEKLEREMMDREVLDREMLQGDRDVGWGDDGELLDGDTGL